MGELVANVQSGLSLIPPHETEKETRGSVLTAYPRLQVRGSELAGDGTDTDHICVRNIEASGSS
jgi:hypothetical protein